MGGETYTDIELIGAQIATRIRSLHNHLLPSHGTTRERKFITSTAPALLSSSSNVHSGVSICQVIGDSPGRFVGAHVRSSAITARDGIGVSQWVVVDIASFHGSGTRSECGLARPGTGWLTAIPVACCCSGS